VGLGCHALPLDGPVDGGAADAEELSDLGGAVLAAVHQRDQVRLLAAVGFGCFPRSRPLALATFIPSRVRSRITSDSIIRRRRPPVEDPHVGRPPVRPAPESEPPLKAGRLKLAGSDLERVESRADSERRLKSAEITLDFAGGADVRSRRVVARVTKSLTLPQHIPALVELHFELLQPGALLFRSP
jgi:hypothetical protein